jgi:hypothetical protein
MPNRYRKQSVLDGFFSISNLSVLDFKLLPCSECGMLPSVWFNGACGLNASVSEHSVPSS